MSYQSNQSTTPSVSPSSSTRSIQTGSSAYATGSLQNPLSSSAHQSSRSSACAFPSWPSGSIFNGARSPGMSFISDEDLFGQDNVPYLNEPPPPPRSAEAWGIARPLLPPVATTTRRSSSGKKHSRHSSGKK